MCRIDKIEGSDTMDTNTQLHALASYLGSLYRKDFWNTCGDIELQYELHEKINKTLLKLSHEECIFMMNEYFSPAHENWWCINYEKRVFIKKKNMALHAFFRCLTA